MVWGFGFLRGLAWGLYCQYDVGGLAAQVCMASEGDSKPSSCLQKDF